MRLASELCLCCSASMCNRSYGLFEGKCHQKFLDDVSAKNFDDNEINAPPPAFSRARDSIANYLLPAILTQTKLT